MGTPIGITESVLVQGEGKAGGAATKPRRSFITVEVAHVNPFYGKGLNLRTVKGVPPWELCFLQLLAKLSIAVIGLKNNC